jgi:DNA repair protein RecO (recombination protein O)
MEWRDEGAIIAVRPHGETAAIIEVFTQAHGRHAGVVRGGGSRKAAAMLQPGTQVQVTWSARLGEHLGTFAVEPLASRAAMLSDRLALAGLNALAALLHVSLPERDPHPGLYALSLALLDRMQAGGDWGSDYLRWEIALLEELGFGLDLARCAVTGATEGLAYVSPRTGRAVSRDGAGDWADRLLPLPSGLNGDGPMSAKDVIQGLALTGHFLAKGLEEVLHGRPLPEARARLVAALARAVE